MFIGILERKWSCHPSRKRTLYGIYCAENRKIFEVQWFWHCACGQSNSWAWREHTLPSCTQKGICSDAPLAVRKTTWHCGKFCVCANLCFYAVVCLCMGVWICLFMYVIVLLCVLILKSTSAWHTDARMQSWPPALAKQCVTGQFVAQLLLLLSVKNAILNYL